MVPERQFSTVLAAARVGAEWAITALYREFHPRLLRYLRAQAPAHGDDLASEVWLDVAAALGRFEGDATAFRRWLFTIAHRRLIDLRRADARRRAFLSRLESFHDSRVDGDPGASVLAASETEAALVRIGRLSPDQAQVVLLRVVAGLTVEDVAAIVGKKPGSVRVLQHRALKRLAEELAREREAVVTQ
jgi:RNA polymerase sigma-70 factor (ECF subfamily)